MNFSTFYLPLDKIDLSNESYRITTNADVSALAESIHDIGLINPPILKKDEAKFIVISGFRRIAACQRLKWPKLEVKAIPEALYPLDCCMVAIAENSLQRSLNLIETSRAIHLLSAEMPDSAELSTYLAKLGLPCNRSMVERIGKLCLMHGKIQTGILAGYISLPMADVLDGLERMEAIAFSELFGRLKPSLNKQRELFTLIKEISRRESRDILQVMTSDSFKDTMESVDLDRNQRLQTLRSYLKKRRYPNLTDAENRFQDVVESLKLKGGTRIIPPAHFERETYLLQMPFKNREELNRHKKELDRIAGHSSIKALLSR